MGSRGPGSEPAPQQPSHTNTSSHRGLPKSTHLHFIARSSRHRTEREMPSAAAEMPDMGMEEGDYPDGSSEVDEEIEDLLCLDLTHEEIKAAFRLFDDTGEGFITVLRFRLILKEIDDDFSDDELDEIIAEIDTDKSDTIDFNEFVKIMT